MAENQIPFLCGGTFFFLISGIKQGVSAREHAQGIKDEVKNEDIMDDLILAVAGRRYGPSKAEVSQYRSCKVYGTSGIPFDDKSVRDSLTDAVLHDYATPHKRITEFLDKYMVGELQRTWFVKALLDIILHDDSIDEDDIFFIQYDGTPKTKREIRKMRVFDYQPFVLGVVHFIISERYGKNKEGQATFDSWKIREGNEYRYNGNAGAEVPYKITVNDCRPNEETLNEPEITECGTPIDDLRTDDEVIIDNLIKPLEILASAAKIQKHNMAEKIRQNNKKTDSYEDEPETFEAEVVDEEAPSGAAEEDKTKTVIQQQTNIIQNGKNNFNVTNNGTMNFNF